MSSRGWANDNQSRGFSHPNGCFGWVGEMMINEMEELSKSEEKNKQENPKKDFWGEQHRKTIIDQITLGIYDDWYKPIREYNYKSEN